MNGDIWVLIGINLTMMVAVTSLVAIRSFRTKYPSYIDAFWGIGFTQAQPARPTQRAEG